MKRSGAGLVEIALDISVDASGDALSLGDASAVGSALAIGDSLAIGAADSVVDDDLDQTTKPKITIARVRTRKTRLELFEFFGATGVLDGFFAAGVVETVAGVEVRTRPTGTAGTEIVDALLVAAFFTADFFTEDFFTAAFLAIFFAADFLGAAFFATAFFTADFFAADFFAPDFFTALFFAFAFFTATDSSSALECPIWTCANFSLARERSDNSRGYCP